MAYQNNKKTMVGLFTSKSVSVNDSCQKFRCSAI